MSHKEAFSTLRILFWSPCARYSCRVPSETQLVQRRNLRGENKALYEEAVSLCTVSNTLPKNIQLCIDDVMATGDVNLAQVW
jgi:hypothetical protein